MTELEVGRVYKIKSRNLVLGVYKGNGGFIGIREKFGHKYLFTEYHHEMGPPFGTVKPYEVLDEPITTIPLKEGLGTIDDHTKRPVAFDKPVVDGGRGWFYTDTNEASRDIFPREVSNRELFEYLTRLEERL